MTDWYDVRVVSPRPHGKDSYIELDGVRMKGVRKVTIEVSAVDANRVVVEFFAKSINVDTEVEHLEPISPNGRYDAAGHFIHDDDCNFLGHDHIGQACSGTDPRPQKVDEPYHEWHRRTGVTRDEACWDCNPANAKDYGDDMPVTKGE